METKPRPQPTGLDPRLLLMALTYLVVIGFIVGTTVVGVRDTRTMALGFSRDRAQTVIRTITRTVQQSGGAPEVLEALVSDPGDPDVMVLEFLKPDGTRITDGARGGTWTLPELFRLGLGRQSDLLLREDEGHLDLWAVVRPGVGWMHRMRRMAGPRGPRWTRGPGPWWMMRRQAHGPPGPGERCGPGAAGAGPPAPPVGGPGDGTGPHPPHGPPGWMVVHMAFSTRGADEMIAQAYTHAAAVAAGVALLLAVGLLGVAYQRRSLRLARELKEQEHLAALGSMAAVLAHEIRNPLASVKGYAQYARERAGEDQRLREAMDVIVSESTRLENLVRSLLTFARDRPLDMEPVDVPRVIHGVVKNRAPELEGIEVELDLEDAVARADSQALEQILHNMLGNAVAALPEGRGRLKISVRRGGGWVTLRVEDDGPGVPEDMAPRIFEPFVTGRTKGTGLGLAVVKRLVTRMGGTVTLRRGPCSLPGACFEVKLTEARHG